MKRLCTCTYDFIPGVTACFNRHLKNLKNNFFTYAWFNIFNSCTLGAARHDFIVYSLNFYLLLRWKSPAGVELQASEASGPQDQVADTNVLEHLYTSQFQLDPLTCEESGIYSCHGSSPNSRRVEGRMNINVQCKLKRNIRWSWILLSITQGYEHQCPV